MVSSFVIFCAPVFSEGATKASLCGVSVSCLLLQGSVCYSLQLWFVARVKDWGDLCSSPKTFMLLLACCVVYTLFTSVWIVKQHFESLLSNFTRRVWLIMHCRFVEVSAPCLVSLGSDDLLHTGICRFAFGRYLVSVTYIRIMGMYFSPMN